MVRGIYVFFGCTHIYTAELCIQRIKTFTCKKTHNFLFFLIKLYIFLFVKFFPIERCFFKILKFIKNKKLLRKKKLSAVSFNFQPPQIRPPKKFFFFFQFRKLDPTLVSFRKISVPLPLFFFSSAYPLSAE